MHEHLDLALQTMAGKRRDPTIAPFSPEPLVTALNACVVPQNRFDVRDYGCALEFLYHLLEHLDIHPGYIVSNIERGTCQGCGMIYTKVIFQKNISHLNILYYNIGNYFLKISCPDSSKLLIYL